MITNYRNRFSNKMLLYFIRKKYNGRWIDIHGCKYCKNLLHVHPDIRRIMCFSLHKYY